MEALVLRENLEEVHIRHLQDAHLMKDRVDIIEDLEVLIIHPSLPEAPDQVEAIQVQIKVLDHHLITLEVVGPLHLVQDMVGLQAALDLQVIIGLVVDQGLQVIIDLVAVPDHPDTTEVQVDQDLQEAEVIQEVEVVAVEAVEFPDQAEVVRAQVAVVLQEVVADEVIK